jgi:large subunit ribosomal protein L24
MVQNDTPSAQPDKQRKAIEEAPHHQKRKEMAAHLSEDLMIEYDRRSMPVCEGDTVVIQRGDYAGTEGEVLEIDYDERSIQVDGAVLRKADGTQVPRPIHPSNVTLTALDLTDPKRRAAIERKGVTVEEPEPEPEPEPDSDSEAETETGTESESETGSDSTADHEPEPATGDEGDTEEVDE